MEMPATALGGRALGDPEDRELLDCAVVRNGGEEEEKVPLGGGALVWKAVEAGTLEETVDE